MTTALIGVENSKSIQRSKCFLLASPGATVDQSAFRRGQPGGGVSTPGNFFSSQEFGTTEYRMTNVC